MATATNDIPARLEKLVRQCGDSASELARIGGVSKQTVHNWLRGLGFHDSTMEEFSRTIGVDFEWLRDGDGHDVEQIRRFKDRQAEADQTSSRVAEDSMPHTTPDSPARGPYAVIEKTAARLSPSGIAETIADILNDDSSPLMERLGAAERMAVVLARRISIERKRHGG